MKNVQLQLEASARYFQSVTIITVDGIVVFNIPLDKLVGGLA